MDGRDVDPQAGVKYVDMIQKKMDELHFGHIADIGGRYWGMDRDKNMDRVDVHYRLMVDHDGPSFSDYHDFFKQQYEELPKLGKAPSDEFLIPHYNENVDGRIGDNDAIIFMNYRPDRAIQISTLFTNPDFYECPIKKDDGSLAWKPYKPEHPLKNIFYVCTMKYADSVKGVIAFEPQKLNNILGQFLADNGYSQLRIAETEKYAHVTFFFDGTMNFDGVERPELKNCRRVLINSPKVPTYDMQPEMSAYLVLEALLKELDKHDLDVVILNFANCDMVGHTAVHDACVKAVETVDTCVGQIIDWCDKNGGTLIVTADHGNAEEILDENGKPMTAHTTNLVPLCINRTDLKLRQKEGKLADIAPTILELLGAKQPAEMSGESLTSSLLLSFSGFSDRVEWDCPLDLPGLEEGSTFSPLISDNNWSTEVYPSKMEGDRPLPMMYFILSSTGNPLTSRGLSSLWCFILSIFWAKGMVGAKTITQGALPLSIV